MWSQQNRRTRSKPSLSYLHRLKRRTCRLMRCGGLNYKSYSKCDFSNEHSSASNMMSETGAQSLKQAVAGPTDAIAIPRIAQAQCDYEGELSVVIGEDAKNVTEDPAVDYVAACATSKTYPLAIGKENLSTLDQPHNGPLANPLTSYAPMGPCLVSASVLGAADSLALGPASMASCGRVVILYV